MKLVFKELSDPTRRKILHLLRKRPMTAGNLAKNFSLAKPTLSAHFAILREADLIEGSKNGTVINCMLKVSVLEEALLAFALAYSLGILLPSGLGIARGGSVMIGIMFMLVGNIAPKTPVPPQRNSFEFDSWNANRMSRFGGKLFLGLGLTFVLGGILLQPKYWAPIFGSLMLTALAAGIWYSIKLRHERSLHDIGTINTSNQ